MITKCMGRYQVIVMHLRLCEAGHKRRVSSHLHWWYTVWHHVWCHINFCRQYSVQSRSGPTHHDSTHRMCYPKPPNKTELKTETHTQETSHLNKTLQATCNRKQYLNTTRDVHR